MTFRSRFKLKDFGFRVKCLRFVLQGKGEGERFRVWGQGMCVKHLGFRA
jgi:hypothetical protein